MANDNIAIINFNEGWEQDGVGPDGLPLFKTVVKIRKSVPPYTEVEYVATEADFEEFPLPYQLFLKRLGARRPDIQGYPLAMWPVCSPADLQNLAVRDIVTVEQLALLANKRSNANEIPPPILELAKRAKKMVELHKEVGKFEAIIDQLRGEVEQLQGDIREANATISAQNSLIAQLRPTPKVA